MGDNSITSQWNSIFENGSIRSDLILLHGTLDMTLVIGNDG
jgi:hypothetical protein